MGKEAPSQQLSLPCLSAVTAVFSPFISNTELRPSGRISKVVFWRQPAQIKTGYRGSQTNTKKCVVLFLICSAVQRIQFPLSKTMLSRPLSLSVWSSLHMSTDVCSLPQLSLLTCKSKSKRCNTKKVIVCSAFLRYSF